MFNARAKKTDEAPSAQPAEVASTQDVVIRTMPQEFFGKEASFAEPERKPEAQYVAPPVPVPTVAIVPAPVTGPLVVKRSIKGIVITAVIFLVLIGVGAYAAVVIIGSVKAQKALVELALVKSQEEEEAARRLAEELKNQPAPVVPVAEAPAKDTDSDGLTDIEELLYRTNFREPDTDKDSFLDGNEVFHRYDPLGLSPQTLLDTGSVKVFIESSFPFSVYYPATWSTVPDVEKSSVSFRSSRQATISVTWVEKDADETLAAWYAKKSPSDDPKNLKETLTKDGYYGLVTTNDRTAYLDVGTAVVMLEYDLGNRTQIEYLQTFQMMVNSLQVVVIPAAETVITPTP